MRLPLVPAAFFGIVLGLSGLGGAWRAAHDVWGLPALVGEGLMLVSACIWLALVILYAAKWRTAREAAMAEWEHPVQCCFIGLAGVATMLVGVAALRYSRGLAELLVTAGAAFAIGFAVWRAGGLWKGGRDPATSTPVLYLPAVAGSFVTAIAAGALGHSDWAQLAFGAGLFSWFAIESVLLHRLYTAPPLPPALRPTLGVQLAPPAVGAAAYLAANGGVPDLMAHALVGYALLQCLMLLRLLPWIRELPFAPSYWAFTFGPAALSTVLLRMVEHGAHGAVAWLAPWIFVATNMVILTIAVATIRLWLRSGLLPQAAPAPR